jgi:hypothetical protein
METFMPKTAIRELDSSNGTPKGDAWKELYRLGEEIGRGWISLQSSVEILLEMRR